VKGAESKGQVGGQALFPGDLARIKSIDLPCGNVKRVRILETAGDGRQRPDIWEIPVQIKFPISQFSYQLSVDSPCIEEHHAVQRLSVVREGRQP
jgi:hypothetical protein